MARTIKSIHTVRGTFNRKPTVTVYINFSDGCYGTHSKYDGKWSDDGLRSGELDEAKRLALKDKNWGDWGRGSRAIETEDAREDMEADRNFTQRATFTGTIDAEIH